MKPNPAPTPEKERAESPSAPRSPRPTSPRTGPRHRSNAYTLIFGAKGNGKTTYARALHRARVAAGGSAIWIDQTGQNGDLGHVVTTMGAAADHLERAYEQGRPYSLVTQLGWGHDYSGFWRLIYGLGDVLLTLDEVGDLADARSISPELHELISKGRNAQVDITTTCRTPPEVHGQLTGNADVVVSFKQVRARYAETLAREYFHCDPSQLLELDRFQYLRTDFETLTRGRISTPK